MSSFILKVRQLATPVLSRPLSQLQCSLKEKKGLCRAAGERKRKHTQEPGLNLCLALGHSSPVTTSVELPLVAPLYILCPRPACAGDAGAALGAGGADGFLSLGKWATPALQKLIPWKKGLNRTATKPTKNLKTPEDGREAPGDFSGVGPFAHQSLVGAFSGPPSICECIRIGKSLLST